LSFFSGGEGENKMQDVEIFKLKGLYDEILDRGEPGTVFTPDETQRRVNIVRFFEQVLHTKFDNTKDFKMKMDNFFAKKFYRGYDLREARKSRGWEKKDLANHLGVSHTRILRMETNQKPLTEQAINFIIEMGFERTIKVGKPQKKACEGVHREMAQNGTISPKKTLQDSQVTDSLAA